MPNERGSGEEGLVVSALERSYPQFQLGPVSFHLPPGRALGLLGSNGAGKTTLLAGLAGQARLQAGTVVWNGQHVRRGEWRYKHQVSYVRDVPAFYGELTVRQTMAFVARLYPTWRPERAAHLLGTFDLDPAQRVQALSRGMRAKLGLLLAASHDVRLLLLDEVTAGIDADTREDVQRFLRALVAAGVAVLVSSHIFEDIEQVSDDILILRRGMPVFSGTLQSVQRLTVAVMPAPGPLALTQSPSLVGSWNDAGQTTVLMRAPLEGQVEDALAASGSIRRAATVRDLYFAFRERA
jgi:ABC-2 type transport system ATP-binding protein